MGIKENVERIRDEIRDCLQRIGRKDFPLIVAVTKTVPAEALFALEEVGIKDVGENYVQEMLSKMERLPHLNWHFIGTLQRNKVKYIVGKVKLIHSVDSIPLAHEINKRAEKRGCLQNVLVQINQGEETKGGIAAQEVSTFISELNNFKNIVVKGLMAMPPFKENPEEVRPYFREVRELMDLINKRSLYREPLSELSMGMSHDYLVAVEEGSTILRIGTAIFGERKR